VVKKSAERELLYQPENRKVKPELHFSYGTLFIKVIICSLRSGRSSMMMFQTMAVSIM
jgi:hypothetical protein